MDISDLLISLGLSVDANAIYDFIKQYFLKTTSPTEKGLKDSLISALNIEGAEIASDTIIEFLAKNGDITISGSKIFANDSILLASYVGTKFQIKDGSSSKTNHTSIEVGENGSIMGQNGSTIKQSEDGISFSV
jgi:hypothetical protein